jgi:hypothetical protein
VNQLARLGSDQRCAYNPAEACLTGPNDDDVGIHEAALWLQNEPCKKTPPPLGTGAAPIHKFGLSTE